MGQSDARHHLFDAEMMADPYPDYHAMRNVDPVQWIAERNAWVVTGHREVAQVMKSRQVSADRVSAARGKYAEKYQPVFDILAKIMVQVDEPMHRHIRDLVHAAFTRTAVQEFEDRIIALCEDLIAPGLERGEIEFMSEFAVPLPILVISEIVGVPPEDRAQIKEWCDAYSFLILNFYVNLTDEQFDEYMPKVLAFSEYLRDKIREAEANPRDDLISSLTLAAKSEDALTIDDVVANCMILLNAGNETTSCILGTGMKLLMENPGELAKLRADPSLIPNAIEEFLRLEGPVQLVGRVAGEDMEVGGQTISKGQLILTVLAAANRDPAEFADPDRLDITRDTKHQLGFGTGTHLCAGIQLARFEAKVAFEFLLSRLGSFQRMSSVYEYSPNLNLRGLATLPLRISPA